MCGVVVLCSTPLRLLYAGQREQAVLQLPILNRASYSLEGGAEQLEGDDERRSPLLS